MAVSEETIKRINELYHKQKSEGLTEKEKAEQATLRREYIQAFHDNLRGTLNTIAIQNPDGTVIHLKERAREKGIR